MAADDGKAKIKFEDAVFDLRTRQLQYLQYLSERDDTPLSHSLSRVIEQAKERIFVDPHIQAKKERKHFSLPASCVAYVTLLASRWGTTKNEVVRRLVDDAAARDLTV